MKMIIPLNDLYCGAREIVITDERAESSYGQPVAVICGGRLSGNAYGPGDAIPFAPPSDPLEFLNEFEPARVTVLCAAREAGIPITGLLATFVG